MKYNPRINEQTARLEGFSASHPYLPEEELQGSLETDVPAPGGPFRSGRISATSLQPPRGPMES